MKKQFDFRKMSFYQIWIRSFCDGNGDGIGDLYGVYDKLEYIKSLGVDGIWFSPIFPSPNADYGYDISDYKNIHPDYGDLDQFRKVLDRAHALGLKVLLDLVINHTSDEHPWFIESCRGGEDNPYRDYYIWRDPLFPVKSTPGRKPARSPRQVKSVPGGKPARSPRQVKSAPDGQPARSPRQSAGEAGKLLPPNNWFSQFEGIAWEYNAQRGQYYLHIFARKQPDLNMDNPRVREEVKEIMRFWLDLGVDGFREDVINFISKVKDLPNGLPFLPAINGLPYYKDGPNLHRYLSEFREVAKEYGAVQIGEAPFTGVKKARSYVAGRGRVLDMLIQFDTMMADCFFTEYVHHPFSLRKLKRAFDRWQYGLAGGGWNALYLENHDHPRVIDRYGSLRYWRESGTMLAAAYLFQRGTPFLYQGQELGMTNIALDSIDKYLDVASVNAYHTFHLREPVEKRLRRIHRSSRDSARTPVQWSSAPGAGFTAGTPWFYINPNYRQINAEAEEKDPSSILHFYRRCLALRKRNETLLKGNYRDLSPCSRRFYMYARSYRGETILVVCSFSQKAFRCSLPRGLAERERDLLLGNYTGEKDAVSATRGRKILLRPYEAQIWRFSRKRKV
ncbi:MAG: alpha-glucosidase [Sarcina sp.]|nr:alpha-glucosidase [Sarcina sp.]